MHITILGGAFDPPHWGHLSAARQTLDFCPVDAVWLMPTYIYNPSFQPKEGRPLNSFSHRLAMTKFLERPKIKVSDFESSISGPSYTYKVLKALKKKYTNIEFSFLIGSDQLTHFTKWYEYQKLLKICKIYVFPRNLNKLEIPFTEMEEVCSPLLKVSDLSSTAIRQKIENGENIENLLPPGVEKYIKKHSLFA